MIPEQESQWREEFESKVRIANKEANSVDFLSLERCDEFIDEYDSFDTSLAWEWYLEARKKAQEEIDGLNEKLALIKDIKQYPTALAYISELKEELKRERSAVDFYADPENWKDNDLLGTSPSVVSEDVSFGNEFGESKHLTVGGKLARQTQQQRKIEL